MQAAEHRRARMRKVKVVDEKRQAAEERRVRRAEQKQARADRIRALKERLPKPTWQEIGDFCGISARGAQAWQEKGSVSVENAHRLAELWGVDFDWLYYGGETELQPASLEQLDAGIREIQRKVDLLEGRLPPADALRTFRDLLERSEPRRPPRNQGDDPEGASRAK